MRYALYELSYIEPGRTLMTLGFSADLTLSDSSDHSGMHNSANSSRISGISSLPQTHDLHYRICRCSRAVKKCTAKAARLERFLSDIMNSISELNFYVKTCLHGCNEAEFTK